VSKHVRQVGDHIEAGELWKCICGKLHGLSVYIIAHWNIEMVHTCDGTDCGVKTTFLEGEIIETEEEE